MPLVKLDELPELQIAEGVSMRVVTAGTVTVAHVSLTAGAPVPEHSHHHEQVVNVIEGELELTVEGKPFSLTPGKVMILPPNVPHSGRAVTDCRVVDVFHPVREDFKGASFGGYSKKD
ncbi:MAG: cupin domain-containing protein [candidate division Zixibacteria bacterium]|nr:cupin domain-containing protein [candidate division Zixibacteria bacterium]